MALRSTDEVVVQLAAAGLDEFIRDVRCEGKTVHGVMEMRGVLKLRADPRFSESAFAVDTLLHPNVGWPRTGFRSDRNSVGRGSLQVVVNLVTGVFEADVDRYNTQDLFNIVAHNALEVLPPALAKLFGRKRPEGETV